MSEEDFLQKALSLSPFEVDEKGQWMYKGVVRSAEEIAQIANRHYADLRNLLADTFQGGGGTDD